MDKIEFVFALLFLHIFLKMLVFMCDHYLRYSKCMHGPCSLACIIGCCRLRLCRWPLRTDTRTPGSRNMRSEQKSRIENSCSHYPNTVLTLGPHWQIDQHTERSLQREEVSWSLGAEQSREPYTAQAWPTCFTGVLLDCCCSMARYRASWPVSPVSPSPCHQMCRDSVAPLTRERAQRIAIKISDQHAVEQQAVS